MDLNEFAESVGADGAVTIAGASTRGGAVPSVRRVAAPAGIRWLQADEMTLCCGAGTAVADVAAALAEVGQRVNLPDGGTVGGALAVGASSIRCLGDGPIRDVLLQANYVSAEGKLVRAGGPTVKNVSGFDLCRLLIGSRGTLGFLGEVILRTRPLAASSQWFTGAAADPYEVFAKLYRPISVLWDGASVWVLLEGHPADIDAQAAHAGLAATTGPPSVPTHERVVVAPSFITSAQGTFVAEVGTGTVHLGEHGTVSGRVTPSAAVVELAARAKRMFDPLGRLNPGVHVG
jgi:FAD/FMN-containing dehydrogenase